MDEVYDVAVIGAGPIGLELAVALKRAGVRYAQFDAKQVGYTISWFPRQTRFFSSSERIAIAGMPLMTVDQNKASREEYLAYLRGVVQAFDLRVRTYEPVSKVRKVGAGFEIVSHPRGGEVRTVAKAVVMATGGTARPRRLGIEGEDLPHVSHYFDDPHTYFGRKVLIVGGKNSAVEAALRCHNAGAEVVISYRRSALPEKSIKYWLMPEITGLIKGARIGAVFESRPVRITPGYVELARADGSGVKVEADFVLLLIGYEADMDLLRDAGVRLVGECQVPVFDEGTMETNVPGLYVAGTAIGGTQDKYSVFIENCHVHVERIVKALTGQRAVVTRVETGGREES